MVVDLTPPQVFNLLVVAEDLLRVAVENIPFFLIADFCGKQIRVER